MRKMLSAAFLMCTVALLSTLSMSAVHATAPTTASGFFDYYFEIMDQKWADGHWFFTATEYETWRGDFEGTAVSFFRVVWFNYPAGPLNVWLRSTFTGTVYGKSGTLLIQFVGWRYLPEDWQGQWVILSGTEDLANLHGQGTWWGPGFEGLEIPGERPDIYYSGQIHFD